jgi:hypothetical protein
MLSFGIEPVRLDPAAARGPVEAYLALASAATFYLGRFEDAVASGQLQPRSALVTRVRGTGPGVSFGSLVDAVRTLPLRWACPFEGSHNVSGATVSGADLLGPGRTDGFLFLRFAPGTQDLPLHVHPSSDRFIFAIGGRGFFHLAPDPLDAIDPSRVNHMPVRDRDALMFHRGAVHTFSTAGHELLLLSYHQPFVSLDDPAQYAVSADPVTPAQFLPGCTSSISFDAAWSPAAAARLDLGERSRRECRPAS